MSKPLVANKARDREASVFHKLVFQRYGNLCWFGARVGHPKKRADDAAHIIKKSKLGPLRYAAVELARPLCRECHIRQESNVEGYAFDLSDRIEAVTAHNEIARVKLEVPAA